MCHVKPSIKKWNNHVQDCKSGFISKSLHPSIHKYIDKTLFQQFEIDDYEIHWGTQFDIDPYDIYYGEFEAKDSPYFAEIEALKGQYELVE